MAVCVCVCARARACVRARASVAQLARQSLTSAGNERKRAIYEDINHVGALHTLARAHTRTHARVRARTRAHNRHMGALKAALNVVHAGYIYMKAGLDCHVGVYFTRAHTHRLHARAHTHAHARTHARIGFPLIQI